MIKQRRRDEIERDRNGVIGKIIRRKRRYGNNDKRWPHEVRIEVAGLKAELAALDAEIEDRS